MSYFNKLILSNRAATAPVFVGDMFVGTSTGLYYAARTGGSWVGNESFTQHPDIPSGQVRKVVRGGASLDTIVCNRRSVGANNGLYYSTDGGANFTQVGATAGLDIFMGPTWNGTNFAAYELASTAAASRAWYSSDGINWNVSGTTFANRAGSADILATSTGTFITGLNSNGTPGTANGEYTVIRSTDNGVTWTSNVLYSNNEDGAVRSIGYDGTNILIYGRDDASGNTAYRSTDDGATWSSTGLTVPYPQGRYANFNRLAYDGTALIGGFYRNTNWRGRTTDAGVSFTFGGSSSVVSNANGDIVYDGTIYIETDETGTDIEFSTTGLTSDADWTGWTSSGLSGTVYSICPMGQPFLYPPTTY